MEQLTKAWKGEEKLWKVFWLYNFMLGALITTGLEAVSGINWLLAAVFAVFALVWAVWVVVALWRGAFNSRWRGWGYIVRGLLVLAVIAFILSFYEAARGN